MTPRGEDRVKRIDTHSRPKISTYFSFEPRLAIRVVRMADA
jgi:hypothetical protein